MAEQSVTLNPGESKVVSFEATPTVAKTYQVTVDGLTGSFVTTEAPIAKFVYVSKVRYSEFTIDPEPGYNPHYACNPRRDYQCFEVDVQNQGNIAGECILRCYLRDRGPVSTDPWSSWSPDSNFECSLWCRDPWYCCFNAEPYRIKAVTINPGEIVTFRGLVWYHGFWDARVIQAKFVGEPGERLSEQLIVMGYA